MMTLDQQLEDFDAQIASLTAAIDDAMAQGLQAKRDAQGADIAKRAASSELLKAAEQVAAELRGQRAYLQRERARVQWQASESQLNNDIVTFDALRRDLAERDALLKPLRHEVNSARAALIEQIQLLGGSHPGGVGQSQAWQADKIAAID